MRMVPEIAWRARGGAEAPLDARLVPLLREIRTRRTLRAATAAVRVSYRAAWDLLASQTRIVGAPLVVFARGRGARLTSLGERLVAADDALRQHLAASGNRFTVRVDRPGGGGALRLVASHDLLLAELVLTSRLPVDLAVRGSVESVAAYAHGEADLAGFHVPVGGERPDPRASPAELLQPRRDRLIRFASREQGLMVAAGNPKRLRSLADVAGRRLRFVNRQRGSGTRLLVDELLRQSGLGPHDLAGYTDEEFTHVAVAATIAAGRADAAVGVRAAAARFGLGFVPLRTERYWLVARQRALGEPGVARLLAALAGPALPRLARRLTGYDVRGAGQVLPVSALQAGPG